VPTVTSLFALSFHPIRDYFNLAVGTALTDKITDDQLKYIRLAIRNLCLSLHHYVQETFQFFDIMTEVEARSTDSLLDDHYVFIHNTLMGRFIMSTQRYYPMLFLLFKILKLLHALVVRPCSRRNTIVGYFYY
jgi:hypothetical protein